MILKSIIMKNKNINFNFSKCLALAPMFGYTNFAFRDLVGRLGADLTFSEFINAKSLTHLKHEQLFNLLKVPSSSFSGIQLFGSSPDDFKEAFKTISVFLESGLSDIKFIDLNLGCPAQKITRIGAGASLLENTENLKKITKVFAKHCPVLYSAKIRLVNSQEQFFRLLKVFEENNFSFITIHARTKNDKFSNKARHEFFENLKHKFNFKIFINGDISSPQLANYFLDLGFDGVMIGRAALLNPFIFMQIKSYLSTKSYKPTLLSDKISFYYSYLGLLSSKKDLVYAKKLGTKLFRGFKNAKDFRLLISKTNSLDDLKELISSFIVL